MASADGQGIARSLAKLEAEMTQGHIDRKLRRLDMNTYRTTYADMTHGLETSIKSDYPSGYGGHVPNLRHQVLFRNTKFDDDLLTRRHEFRDALPDFTANKLGLPYYTANPRVPTDVNTFGTKMKENPLISPPWCIQALPQLQKPPTFRNAQELARNLRERQHEKAEKEKTQTTLKATKASTGEGPKEGEQIVAPRDTAEIKPSEETEHVLKEAVAGGGEAKAAEAADKAPEEQKEAPPAEQQKEAPKEEEVVVGEDAQDQLIVSQRPAMPVGSGAYYREPVRGPSETRLHKVLTTYEAAHLINNPKASQKPVAPRVDHHKTHFE